MIKGGLWLKQKNNNGLFIGIAVAVVVVIAIVVAVVAMNNKNEGSADGGNTAVEYSKIDETIEFDDYDNMMTLSKSIQNGYSTGKVVKIEGLVSHPMSTYSVVQENEDGSKKIGTEFIIEGADSADYPADGSRIVITGEVVEKSPMYFVIKTTPNNVEIK